MNEAVDGLKWFQGSFERFILAATKTAEGKIKTLNDGKSTAA
jgi:hypothetical protein